MDRWCAQHCAKQWGSGNAGYSLQHKREHRKGVTRESWEHPEPPGALVKAQDISLLRFATGRMWFFPGNIFYCNVIVICKVRWNILIKIDWLMGCGMEYNQTRISLCWLQGMNVQRGWGTECTFMDCSLITAQIPLKPADCEFTLQDGMLIYFLWLLQFIHFFVYTAQLFATFHLSSDMTAVKCYDTAMKPIPEWMNLLLMLLLQCLP